MRDNISVFSRTPLGSGEFPSKSWSVLDTYRNCTYQVFFFLIKTFFVVQFPVTIFRIVHAHTFASITTTTPLCPPTHCFSVMVVEAIFRHTSWCSQVIKSQKLKGERNMWRREKILCCLNLGNYSLGIISVDMLRVNMVWWKWF